MSSDNNDNIYPSTRTYMRAYAHMRTYANKVNKRFTEIPIKHLTSDIDVIDWEAFENIVFDFGLSHRIPDEVCSQFYEYQFFNYCLWCDKKDPTKLYTKDGEIINNWQGAFIRFAQTPYDQDEWEKQHGVFDERLSRWRKWRDSKRNTKIL